MLDNCTRVRGAVGRWRLSGRINIRAVVTLVVVVVLLGGLAAGGYKIRKRIIASRALAAGQAALERQDWVEACKELRKYLVRYPDNEEMLAKYAAANLAVRPLDADHIGAALGAYRRLLTLGPGDDEICAKLAKLYLGIRDYEEAAYICRQRLAAAPNDADAMLSLGYALTGGGKPEEAAKILEPLVERHPELVDAYVVLSRISLQQRSPTAKEDAKRWLDQAVTKNPQSAKALARRAFFLYTEAGDRTSARSDLEAADQLKPTDPSVLLLMLELWMNQGELERAESQLQALDALDAKTLAEYDLDRDTLLLLRHTAAARLALCRHSGKESVALADRALTELKDIGRVRFLLMATELYLSGGELGKARECLDQYKQARGRAGGEAVGGAEAEQQVALLEAAEVVEDPAGNAFEAIAKLRALLLTAPENAQAWRMLARAYEKSGQTLHMVQALEEYVSRAPTDPQANLMLARAYRAQDPQRAAQYARYAEQAAPEDLEAKLLRIELYVTLAGSDPSGDEQRRQLAEELVKLREAHPHSGRVRLALAALDMAGGQVDKGLADLRRALEECDDKLKIAFQLCKYAQQHERLDQAVEAAHRAVELQKELAIPRILLAQSQEAGGARDQARRTLEEAVTALAGRERLIASVALAQFLILNQERDNGIKLLRELAAEYPNEPQLKLGLLKLPEVRADVVQAQKLVDELRAIEGESGLLWPVEQARLWLDNDQWRQHQTEVETLLTRVVDTGPANPEPVVLLARFHAARGDLNKAEQVCQRSLDTGRVFTAVVAQLLSLLEQQGRFAEAAELLGKLPKGESDVLSRHRVDVGLATGDFESATEELRARIASDPKDAVSRILLARLLYSQDKKDVGEAMRLLDEAQSLAPGLLDVVAARVAILEGEGQREQALALLNEVVSRRNDFAAYQLRAEFYALVEQFDLAEKDYQHLASLPGETVRGHLLLGRFYRRIQRNAQAIAAYEAGLRADAGNTELRRSLTVALLADDRPDVHRRGLVMLDELLQEATEDPNLLLLKVGALLEQGDAEGRKGAWRLLERIVRLNPRSVPAHVRLIELAREAGDLAKASSMAVRALGSNPGNPELLCVQAVLEVEANNLVVARELAQKVLRTNPRSAAALKVMAEVALRERDVAVAKRYSQQILEHDPGNTDARLLEAGIMLASGQIDEAISYLEHHCQSAARGKDMRCVLTLAKAYQAKKDFIKARQLLDEAEKTLPDSQTVFRSRCEMLAAENRFDEIARLASAIQADAADAAARLEAAAVAFMSSKDRKHLEQAAAWCRRAVELEPKRLSSHLSMAQAAYLSGDVKGAEQAFRNALQIDPYNEQVLNNLSWIVGMELGNIDQAIELANTGVAKYPDDAHLRDTRAALLLKAGKLQEASHDLERCLALVDVPPSTRVSALRRLAEVLVRQGRPEQAKQRLQEVLAVDQQQRVLSEADRAAIEKQIQQSGR